MFDGSYFKINLFRRCRRTDNITNPVVYLASDSSIKSEGRRPMIKLLNPGITYPLVMVFQNLCANMYVSYDRPASA